MKAIVFHEHGGVDQLRYADFPKLKLAAGAAEYVVESLVNLLETQENVSFEDTAALPIVYGTAHRMILNRGRVKAGDKVLIMGASGGVGTCCVQLAKMVAPKW